MKLDTLLEVQLLARQLDQLINGALSEQENAPHHTSWTTKKEQNIYQRDIDNGDLHTGHLAAGIKRKSMDLTRQLAKMRRGD